MIPKCIHRDLSLVLSILYLLLNLVWIQPAAAESGAESISVDGERPWEFSLGGLVAVSSTGDQVYSDLWRVPVQGGLYVGLSYGTFTSQHSFLLSAAAGRSISPYPVIDPDYPPLNDLSVSLLANYDSVFKIWSTAGKSGEFSMFLGPGISFYFDAWLPDDPDVDILRYTWISHTAAGFTLRTNWEINPRHSLRTKSYLPIAALGFRPTYSVYTLREETILEEQNILAAIFSTPLFLSYHNFFSIEERIGYYYNISSGLSLFFEYQGVLEFVLIPRFRLEVQNNLSVGVNVKF